MQKVRVMVVAVLAAGALVVAPSAEAAVCPDPVVIQDSTLGNLYVYQACAHNPYDSAIWVSVRMFYESPVDSSVNRTCILDYSDGVQISPYDSAAARVCAGDPGPHGKTGLYMDVCVRLDPLRNVGEGPDPAPSCLDRG